jgi:hypothetical protein
VSDVAKKSDDFMSEFDANHKDASENAAKDRANFVANLGNEVASLLENLTTARTTQASEAAQERAEFFSGLSRSISRFLAETQTNRANDAKMSAEERDRFVASVAEQVASLLDTFNQAHSEMAKSTGEERAAFVSNLASNVAKLIHEVASDRASANAAFFGGAVKSEKKNEIPEVAVRQAKVSINKPVVGETPETQIVVANGPSNVQPEAIHLFDQPPQVVETVQDTQEPATLWDSLVVKKGKSGDHEKPKKKHHGTAVEDNQEDKPDGS